MNHYEVITGGFFAEAECKVEISLYPQDFLAFVKNYEISDIYIIRVDDPFITERKVIKKSKCNYFFAAIHSSVICLLDPLGYPDLETLEKSIKNKSFYIINQLKDEDLSPFWSYDAGDIYMGLVHKGYKTEEQIKNAYSFLEGNICISYKEFIKCKQKAEKGGFKTIRQLCVSKLAGFNDFSDYEEANEFGAPNIKTLEAYRLLRKIKYLFKFRNLSESLLTAVIAFKTTEKRKNDENEAFVDLYDIYSLYKYWQPERKNEEFDKFKTEDDVATFLQSIMGGQLGHYNTANKQFHFSLARIYIDGSNIAFKGPKKGDVNKGLKIPDFKVLEDCYYKLRGEAFGHVKIILDGLVAKRVLSNGSEINRKIFNEMKRRRNLELTIAGETADDTLIQKMRDDPHAYVVVNDNYAKDHFITDRDLGHIINIRFSEKTFEFYGKGYEDLKNRKEFFLIDWKENEEKLFNLRELGLWPYTEDWLSDRRGCCT